DGLRLGRAFLLKGTRRHPRREITVEHLFDVLADMKWIEDLHIREAVKKYDALDQFVGVFHFLNRFLAPLLCQILVTPIVEQSVMEPVLIDRGQFVPQRSIEKLDDFSVPLHNWLLLRAFMSARAQR